MGIYHEIEFMHQNRRYVAELELNVWRENYGADADGNRGVIRDMFEVWGYKVFGMDGSELKKIPADMDAQIEKLTDDLDLSDILDEY